MAAAEYLNPETLPPADSGAYTHVIKLGNGVLVAGQRAGAMDRAASSAS